LVWKLIEYFKRSNFIIQLLPSPLFLAFFDIISPEVKPNRPLFGNAPVRA
jgi:hypothetical protein